MRGSGTYVSRAAVPGLVAVGAVAVAIPLLGHLAGSPLSRIGLLPDDAFYYLGLARSFAVDGVWSFDSGVSTTSGFHPLHAYVLAALYAALQPGTEAFVLLGMLVTVAAGLPALALGTSYTIRTNRIAPAMLFLILMLSRNVSMNLVSAMEWSWVVSLAGVYLMLSGGIAGGRHRRLAVALFCCGLAGSLARADFGLLPASILAAAWLCLRAEHGWKPVLCAASGVAGAASGVLLLFVHNFAFTGEAVQSSARMKQLWMEQYGPTARPIMNQVFALFGDKTLVTETLVSALIPISIWVGVAWVRQRRQGTAENSGATPWRDDASRLLWTGSALSTAGYIVLYALNPVSVQLWYTANLVAPLFLMIALPAAHLRTRTPLGTAAIAILGLLCARQMLAGSAPRSDPEWPYQRAAYDAAQYLKEAKLPGHVGSWNAGILGYFEGGHIVNLDGLVNNDIYSYAREMRLAAYVDAVPITYICDFETMLSNPQKVRRGGYDGPAFLSRLEPIHYFDTPESVQGRLVLYRLNPAGQTVQDHGASASPP
ncbi:MAG: hypothetical protein HYV27_11520 [Candidatus Hydrogenedentes bacterium]|nr:hypothetical protein [Candidatus Hydrogenedentota bacterium]